MENKEIKSYPDLVLHIMHLKQQRFRQEEEIKYSIRELIFSLNPIVVIKRTLNDMAQDSQTKFDMAKVGLDMVITMLTHKIMRQTSGLKGFVGKLLIGKFSSSFLYSNAHKVISAIRNKIRPSPIEITQR